MDQVVGVTRFVYVELGYLIVLIESLYILFRNEHLLVIFMFHNAGGTGSTSQLMCRFTDIDCTTGC